MSPAQSSSGVSRTPLSCHLIWGITGCCLMPPVICFWLADSPINLVYWDLLPLLKETLVYEQQLITLLAIASSSLAQWWGPHHWPPSMPAPAIITVHDLVWGLRYNGGGYDVFYDHALTLHCWHACVGCRDQNPVAGAGGVVDA